MGRTLAGSGVATLALALALTAAACGDDDEDPAPAESSAPATSAAASTEAAPPTSSAAPESAPDSSAAPETTAADASSEAAGGATFTPDEVKAASDPWECGSVYPVPKDAAGTKLAFINPGPADPYVAAWSAGMKDAAEFYGVELKEGFLGNYDYSKLIDTYNTLGAFDPEVVGTSSDGPTAEALKAAVDADGSKLLLLDTKIDGAPQIGLENVEGGQIMGQELQKAVEPLLQGDWAGKDLVIVGITAEGCVPCDERVDGAFEALQQFLPESDTVKYIRVVEKTATVDVIQRRMTDTITANPDANFIVAALDDGSGGGAFNAVRQAGIEDRARIASIGGDNLAVENMLAGSPAYVASVDAKPYCEAWNWVEAALAVKAGQPFDTYPYTGVLTPANAESYRWRLDIAF
jgi:ABC-type sugar transport system substrate-binding protein